MSDKKAKKEENISEEELEKEDLREDKESIDEQASEVSKEQELEDKYLRLYSEFENFRRRTAREKVELIGSANEGVIADLLPVLDDFDRAMQSMDDAQEVEAVKEGVNLIYEKLHKILVQKGLEEIDAVGKELDTEFHEAITQSPAPNKKLIGKIMDVAEKGYTLNGKVIRYTKVIIGR